MIKMRLFGYLAFLSLLFYQSATFAQFEEFEEFAQFEYYLFNPVVNPVSLESNLPLVKDKPGVLLVIHDLDLNVNRPFFFEFNRLQNFYLYNLGSKCYEVLQAVLVTNQGNTHDFCEIKQGVINNRALVIQIAGDINKERPWDLRCRSHYRAN